MPSVFFRALFYLSKKKTNALQLIDEFNSLLVKWLNKIHINDEFKSNDLNGFENAKKKQGMYGTRVHRARILYQIGLYFSVSPNCLPIRKPQIWK